MRSALLKVIVLLVLPLLLTGCTTTQPHSSQLPDGYYMLDASPWFYGPNLCLLESKKPGVHTVSMLKERKGSFDLVPKGNRTFSIKQSNINFDKIRRSIKGDATMTQAGVLSGTGVVWLKSLGPISRNHRKGAWTLRPATQAEVDAATKKSKKRFKLDF